MSSEIVVVPFHGQGHLFPCSELCLHLAERNFRITLVIQSNLIPSISSPLRNHPLIKIATLSSSPPPGNVPNDHPGPPGHLMAEPLADLLSQSCNDPDSQRPVCVILDVMMSWMKDTCQQFKIPIVSFFTSGACSAAMEYAIWKLKPENLKPGEVLRLPGLPDDLSLTFSDLNQPDPPPPPHGPHGGGPPPNWPGGPGGNHPGGGHPPPRRGPGGRPPPWVGETDGSIALLMNTSDDLERPFLDYLAKETGKPVWGVGPLLPAQFWRSTDSVVHDAELRSKKKSNVSEEEVIEWLGSKPRGSVVYIAFGTEVGPSQKELEELAASLAESSRSFIWALQTQHGPPGRPPVPPHGEEHEIDGFYPDDLVLRSKGRGLIIKGWAPQLLILSHPSTVGFLSHCGWNSTLEALGRGVPLLAWPIRGDQHYNAKLIASHLKVGFMIRRTDGSDPVKKEDIINGIEKLLADDATKKRAADFRSLFAGGFPASSSVSLDALRDFIQQSCDQK